MVAVANEVGAHRYRESYGRYFEEFTAGDVYEHRPGRTISEADNTWFTLLTMNQHPLHFDAAYASKSEFGRPLVNSCLTLSIVAGMSVSDVSQKAIGNLGWTDIRLIAPVFIGDTIYAESEVLSKREFGQTPHAGDRHSEDHRQEGRRYDLHDLRAQRIGAEAGPRRGRSRGLLASPRRQPRIPGIIKVASKRSKARRNGMAAGAVNSGGRLDRLPISAFHYRVLGLVGAGMFLDAFEIYLAGGVLAALVKSGWSDLAHNGWFISITFAGMMVGAWFAGVFGDRYGRRFSYQLNLLIFGLASLAGAVAPSIEWLIAARFVMGIGLGAEIVVGYVTLSEFVPPRQRPLGSALSAITNSALFFFRRSPDHPDIRLALDVRHHRHWGADRLVSASRAAGIAALAGVQGPRR